MQFVRFFKLLQFPKSFPIYPLGKKKNPCIIRSAQFKPMLFKGQLYFIFLFPSTIFFNIS